ncbi:inclusion [Metaplexis yellow mottle-associated virus]|uniref:Transactivator/viroplasmin protein n=1 Tax=Metaplexis yellow mottle-associated virus TaxID=2878269 RepID=A0A8K1M7C4_9VIRU|nr:inclusion [Metaplexis yellow mottle-associated virus]UBN09113.1 inclusion [Metaplexis yellow mottle-associated virus]
MNQQEVERKISLIQAEIRFRALQLNELNYELHRLMVKAGKFPESTIPIVNNGSSSPVTKEEPSPEQTATGKDVTNPLQAVSLLKTEVTQTGLDQSTKAHSEHSSDAEKKEGLRPNKGSKKFYTIFTGKNRGVYSNWGTVSAITAGKPLSFKSFGTEKEALIALNEHYEEVEKLPRLTRLRGMPTTAKESVSKEKPISLTRKDFVYYFNLAESSRMDEEKSYFTINKKKISFFGFLANAKPEMVRDTYHAGLCTLIYPSSNLQEIRLLPKGVQEAIKKFRKNVLKQSDAHLFIKITSSLMDWKEDGEPRLPYHWIKIGTAKKDFEVPNPEEKEITEDLTEVIHDLRAQRLAAVNQQMLGIFADSKIRVNYSDDKTIIISDWKEKISDQDGIKISGNEAVFNDGKLDVSDETAELFCRYAPKDHHCPKCPTTEESSE